MEIVQQKLEVIESIREYLGRFIPGIEDTITLLRRADEHRAIENFSAILEGLEWLAEASTLTADVIGEPLDIPYINRLIQEISDALENSDYVLLTDLFEYELLPKLNEWANKLIKQ